MLIETPRNLRVTRFGGVRQATRTRPAITSHNQGNHGALFDDTDQYLAGSDITVPIVDHAGNFQGWATFHVVSAAGGGTKTITGYFQVDYQGSSSQVGIGCQNGSCPRYLGTYVLKLIR